jgi:hypothetical protein
MSELQPKKVGRAVITRQQLIDAINKAEINSAELLHYAFSEFTKGTGIEYKNPVTGETRISQTEFEGGSYNDEFKFVSNRKLYKLKAQMEQYVESICKSAKDGKITKEHIEKCKRNNIMYSGINFAAGFVVAATFLSTLIPKFQYYVTRKKTGMDVFPGTYDYVHHRETDG